MSAFASAAATTWTDAPRQERPRVASTAGLPSVRRIAHRCAAAPTPASSSESPPSLPGGMVFEYTTLEVETQLGISLFDITPQINECVGASGVRSGFVNVLSRHTTTVRLRARARARGPRGGAQGRCGVVKHRCGGGAGGNSRPSGLITSPYASTLVRYQMPSP
jgi:hypothetical protein